MSYEAGGGVTCFSGRAVADTIAKLVVFLTSDTCAKKKGLTIKARAERATRPTYKAGLPASTQGAAGGVVAGLRVEGEVNTVNWEILLL